MNYILNFLAAMCKEELKGFVIYNARICNQN